MKTISYVINNNLFDHFFKDFNIFFRLNIFLEWIHTNQFRRIAWHRRSNNPNEKQPSEHGPSTRGIPHKKVQKICEVFKDVTLFKNLTCRRQHPS